MWQQCWIKGSSKTVECPWVFFSLTAQPDVKTIAVHCQPAADEQTASGLSWTTAKGNYSFEIQLKVCQQENWPHWTCFHCVFELCCTFLSWSQHDDLSRHAKVKLATMQHASGSETPAGLGQYWRVGSQFSAWSNKRLRTNPKCKRGMTVPTLHFLRDKLLPLLFAGWGQRLPLNNYTESESCCILGSFNASSQHSVSPISLLVQLHRRRMQVRVKQRGELGEYDKYSRGPLLGQ